MSFKLTKQIATQLGEVAPVPLAQIRNIIELAGADTAQALADEAVTIAAGDGMLTPDGKPRTVGGIFFHLARQRLPPEIVQEVWMSWARRKQLQRERAGLPPHDPQAPARPKAAPEAAPGPALPAFRWEESHPERFLQKKMLKTLDWKVFILFSYTIKTLILMMRHLLFHHPAIIPVIKDISLNQLPRHYSQAHIKSGIHQGNFS